MPSVFEGDYALTAAGRERENDRFLARVERLGVQIEKNLQAVMGEQGPPDPVTGRKPSPNVSALDKALGTNLVDEVKALVQRVDTDFTSEELADDDKAFLKSGILSVFKSPTRLRDYGYEDVLKEWVGVRSDDHMGTRSRLGGAFGDAAGKAVVLVQINPGTVASDVRLGKEVPAANALEADVNALAKRVAEATESYYSQGLHRAVAPPRPSGFNNG